MLAQPSQLPRIGHRPWIFSCPGRQDGGEVRELAAAIRGLPGGVRPAPGEGIVLPPGACRAEGPRLARLTITPDQVTFSTSGQETAHRSAGLDARGRAVLVELAVSRARPGGAPLRAAAAGAAQAGMHAGLVQAVNNRAGHCFLDGAAGQTLPAEVAAATAGNAALRLAVDVRMRPARAAVGDGGAAGAGDAAGAAGRGSRCTAPPY